ncbi:hypothetical protein ACWGBV_16915 [Streptomyces sp. NPDC055051]
MSAAPSPHTPERQPGPAPLRRVALSSLFGTVIACHGFLPHGTMSGTRVRHTGAALGHRPTAPAGGGFTPPLAGGLLADRSGRDLSEAAPAAPRTTTASAVEKGAEA